MKKEKTIYHLDLHESIQLEGTTHSLVFRVPGGWVYQIIAGIEKGGYPQSLAVSTVFVPLNHEFSPVFIPQKDQP